VNKNYKITKDKIKGVDYISHKKQGDEDI